MEIEELESGNIRIKVKMEFGRNAGRQSLKIRSDSGKLVAGASYTSALLLVVRARRWRKALDEGRVKNPDTLARLVGLDGGRVRKILHLARISPRIVRAILENRHPADLTIGKLIGLKTLDWSEQEKICGI